MKSSSHLSLKRTKIASWISFGNELPIYSFFLLSFLLVLGATNAAAAEESNLETGWCLPASSTTYVFGDSSKKIVHPAYQYNRYIMGAESPIDIEGLLKLNETRVSFGSKPIVRRCEADTNLIPKGIFALTPFQVGPKLIGAACDGFPRLHLTAYPGGGLGNQIDDYFSQPYSGNDILGPEEILHIREFQKARIGSDEYRRLRPRTEFENIFVQFLDVIAKQCETIPQKMAIIVSIGRNDLQAIYEPSYLIIEASKLQNGWTFRYGNLDLAKQIHEQGTANYNAEWNDRLDELKLFKLRREEQEQIDRAMFWLVGISNWWGQSTCNAPITKENVGEKLLAGCDDVRHFAIPDHAR